MGNDIDTQEDVLHDDDFDDTVDVAVGDFDEEGAALDADVFVGISGDTDSE